MSFKFGGHNSHFMNLRQGDVSHSAGIFGSNKMQMALLSFGLPHRKIVN